MASNLQIFIVLLISYIAIFVFGWQAKELLVDRKITCAWNKCRHNKDGKCSKRGSVELNSLIVNDHLEVLRCDSFAAQEEKKPCINMKA